MKRQWTILPVALALLVIGVARPGQAQDWTPIKAHEFFINVGDLTGVRFSGSRERLISNINYHQFMRLDGGAGWMNFFHFPSNYYTRSWARQRIERGYFETRVEKFSDRKPGHLSDLRISEAKGSYYGGNVADFKLTPGGDHCVYAYVFYRFNTHEFGASRSDVIYDSALVFSYCAPTLDVGKFREFVTSLEMVDPQYNLKMHDIAK